MTTPLVLGEITIHPVVEQQGAFFDALSFFPNLSKEVLDENRNWLRPEFIDAQDRLVLCIQSFVIKTPSTRASAITSRGRRGRSGTC